MATSQRLSRGFHWLGLLLAASLFVIGLAFVVTDIMNVFGLYWPYNPQTLIMRGTIGLSVFAGCASPSTASSAPWAGSLAALQLRRTRHGDD
jgi:hypothetical protein